MMKERYKTAARINDVLHPLLKYLSKLSPLILLALLTGCASSPPIYTSSADINAAFLSLQTTDPKLQADRFGIYAKVAGKSFIGTRKFDGKIMAASFNWIIPGVVLEEKSEFPWYRQTFQYNPESQRIDVFNMLEHYNVHIRELSVLPDGSVQWPSTALGLEPTTHTIIGKNGSLDRTEISGEVVSTLHEVASAEFQSQVAKIRADLAAEEREKSRSRMEFMNAVAQGLNQASEEIRAENQANQLRLAERQSEIMRIKDAEMRAGSRRLDQQQREAEIREGQQTQQRNTKSDTGYITFIDNSEEKKKQREVMEKMEQDSRAYKEAARQARAQGDADAAALQAKIRAQAAKNSPPPGSTATRQ